MILQLYSNNANVLYMLTCEVQKIVCISVTAWGCIDYISPSFNIFSNKCHSFGLCSSLLLSSIGRCINYYTMFYFNTTYLYKVNSGVLTYKTKSKTLSSSTV